ncbi:hypothetical protein ElyMa_001382000 [Elysia marginata]|uniref:Uncharacterized protein n=1 Tax=Elysia marginata TaxID=1093978 RepID=A0AAV4IRU0_9GAST|nr:hypothetical protein ElyMa_001382000 [Elysia marginata]
MAPGDDKTQKQLMGLCRAMSIIRLSGRGESECTKAAAAVVVDVVDDDDDDAVVALVVLTAAEATTAVVVEVVVEVVVVVLVVSASVFALRQRRLQKRASSFCNDLAFSLPKSARIQECSTSSGIRDREAAAAAAAATDANSS